MLKRFREEELLGQALSEKQKKEIARAQSAPDEEIDTLDIPETRELPADAVSGIMPTTGSRGAPICGGLFPGEIEDSSLHVRGYEEACT